MGALPSVPVSGAGPGPWGTVPPMPPVVWVLSVDPWKLMSELIECFSCIQLPGFHALKAQFFGRLNVLRSSIWVSLWTVRTTLLNQGSTSVLEWFGGCSSRLRILDKGSQSYTLN